MPRRTMILLAVAAAFLLLLAFGPSIVFGAQGFQGLEAAVFVFFVGLGAIVGYLIGKPKGKELAGLVVGGLFSIFGWLILLTITDERPRCPHCKGVTVAGATKCMHCASALV